MGRDTHIEWCDHSWNPWQGCRKVSPGCAHCYMHRDKKRYGQDPSEIKRSSQATFRAPLSKKWSEPALVFTCSWSDFFIPEADLWRADAWDIIRATPHLTYQILTKRPQRIEKCLPSDWGDGWPNVWLGCTCENQQMFWERWQYMEHLCAVVRFISAEPLLAPLVIEGQSDSIDWLIVGGESGPNKRAMDPSWVRSLREQCKRTGIPFFFKQWNGRDGCSLDGNEHKEFPRVWSSAA